MDHREEFFEPALDPLCVLTLDGRVVDVNPAAVQSFGWTRDELGSMDLAEVIHPEDVERALAAVRGVAEGRRLNGFEVRCRTRAGEHRAIAWSSVARGSLIYAVGHDVTDQRRLVDALRVSESDTGRLEKLQRSILDALPVLVALCARDGEILAVNRTWRLAAERNALGLPRHGVGANYLDVCRVAAPQEASARRVLEGLSSVLAGTAERHVSEYEIALDGGSRWYRVEVAPFVGAALEGAVVIHFDITERRSLEQQLRHAQKMEAIGVLAGGVAHDFNNLLQAIQGFAGLAMEAVTGTVAAEDLEQVLVASERATTLVRQLLTLSRKGDAHEREPLEVADLIRGLSKMLGRLLGPDVKLTLDVPATVATVVGDPGQLEQVLMNLCLNARDAVAGHGEVTIRADRTELGASDLEAFEWARPGRFARIRVIDDGPGIASEHAAHLFEPFFTTKSAGEGSGLGLAIVWSIVQQHGGTVEVSSSAETGTCVIVQIPIVSGAARVERAPRAPRPADGVGRLLLAEDDAFVRKFMQRTLEAAGYELRVAPDGEEAKRLFDGDPEGFDLALLDAVMPGANGQQVFEHLRARRVELPVLFVSGYSFDVLGATYLPGPDVPLLAKPFTASELLDAVRVALSAAAGRTPPP